jgi:hypothetical protein
MRDEEFTCVFAAANKNATFVNWYRYNLVGVTVAIWARFCEPQVVGEGKDKVVLMLN